MVIMAQEIESVSINPSVALVKQELGKSYSLWVNNYLKRIFSDIYLEKARYG